MRISQFKQASDLLAKIARIVAKPQWHSGFSEIPDGATGRSTGGRPSRNFNYDPWCVPIYPRKLSHFAVGIGERAIGRRTSAARQSPEIRTLIDAKLVGGLIIQSSCRGQIVGLLKITKCLLRLSIHPAIFTRL